CLHHLLAPAKSYTLSLHDALPISVRRTASPPRRSSSHTCGLPPSRAERNDKYFPSGLQLGLPEETPSAVIAIASPPCVEIIHKRCSFLSSFSILVRTA